MEEANLALTSLVSEQASPVGVSFGVPVEWGNGNPALVGWDTAGGHAQREDARLTAVNDGSYERLWSDLED